MMNEKFRINPWLGEKIAELRNNYSNEELRADYEETVQSSPDLTWDVYLGSRALREAIEATPLLAQSCWDMPLPEETQECLYNMYIDTMADLLQFSLYEIMNMRSATNINVLAVIMYLRDHELCLSSIKEITYKLSSTRVMAGFNNKLITQAPKVLETPSLAMSFNIERPSTSPKWFNEFYNRYEHTAGEEDLCNELLNVKTDYDMKNPEFAFFYSGFFKNQIEFWQTYEEVCESHHIRQEVPTPIIPQNKRDFKSFKNDRLLALKKDTIRATIAVLKYGFTFNHDSYAAFFEADYSNKFLINETISHDDGMKRMLSAYAYTNFNFNNRLVEFRRILNEDKSQDKAIANSLHINPWLAKQIEDYRKKHKDSVLRRRYEQAVKRHPMKLWPRFLAEQALLDAVKKNPFLKTPLSETDLDKNTSKALEEKSILNVCDLIQSGDCDLMDMFDYDCDEIIDAVKEFLEQHELQLFITFQKSYRISLPKSKKL